jgi:hypothetical protein
VTAEIVKKFTTPPPAKIVKKITFKKHLTNHPACGILKAQKRKGNKKMLFTKIIVWGIMFAISGTLAKLFAMIWDSVKNEPTWFSIFVYFSIGLSPVILKVCGVF